MAQEHYELLGVQAGATERDVRRAYRAKLFDLEDNARQEVDYLERKQRLEEAFEFCLERARPSDGGAEPALAEQPAGASPAITKKLALRLGLGALAIAALFVGWQFVQQRLVDPYGDSEIDTAGWVAALRDGPQGMEAVVIKPDGTVVAAPRGPRGAQDAAVVWRPDGNRVFILSTREGSSLDIYRWNPVDGRIEKRAVGSRAKTELHFGPEGWPGLVNSGLVVSGGSVFEYNQRTQALSQILPPQLKERKAVGGDESGEGLVSQMESLYREIGTSFLQARWGKDRKWVWAVMASDAGQALVYQPLEAPIQPDGTPGPFPRPVRLATADRIEFTVDKEGQAFFVTHGRTTLNLERTAGYAEDYAKELDAQVKKAGLEVLASESERAAILATLVESVRAKLKELEKAATGAQIYAALADGGPLPTLQPLLGLAGEGRSFSQPAASPVDDRVAIVARMPDPQTKEPSGGIVLISRSAPPVALAEGIVSDISWSKDGKKIVFARLGKDGKRTLFLADLAAQDLRPLTRDGDFAAPSISPQTP
jgi:hypothetical protein